MEEQKVTLSATSFGRRVLATLAAALLVGVAVAQDADTHRVPAHQEDPFYDGFKRYYDTFMSSKENNLPAWRRAELAKEAAAIKAGLLADPEKAVTLLLSAFESGRLGKAEVIHFLNDEGISKDRVLPVVRKIVNVASLSEGSAPVLGRAVSYLTAHGDVSDIERLHRVSGHVNPGFVRASQFAIQQIEIRARGGEEGSPDAPDLQGPDRGNMGPGGDGGDSGKGGVGIAGSRSIGKTILIGLALIVLLAGALYLSRKGGERGSQP